MSEVWQRARRIFDQALEKPRGEREAFVDAASAADPRLRQAVRELLAADADSTHPFDQVPSGSLARILVEEIDRRWLGRRLGPYRIVEHLGQGGMGSVFLAERADAEFEKQVAVKLIRLGMEGEEGLRRFRNERQILAALEHPNIARLLDGGTSPEGLPYLVMEYVQGEPITGFCDRHRLSIRQRLELFRKVCAAVQHAHRNLIVHRDLKASNILVTEDGHPKLLDFGIAKLLDDSLVSAASRETVTVARRMTPDYASPEQLTGRLITTASDVYSLGVLLYELLVGKRPFRRSSRTPQEIEQALDHEVPLPPSAFWTSAGGEQASREARAAARDRATTPSGLARHLQGDLDTIVLKSLRQAPEERYDSATGFSQDIRRYLEGLPVKARPAGFGYRLGKFLRRHAVAVVVAAAGIALLLALTLFSWTQAKLSRQAQREAEEVTRFLVESYGEVDPERARGRRVTAYEVLETSSQRIERELAEQPELQATLMLILGKVHSNLGHYPEAESLLAKALEIRRRLFGEKDPRVAESLVSWSTLLYRLGRFEAAEREALQALAIWRRRGGAEEVAASLQLVADTRWSQGQRAEAVDLYQQSLELREQSGGGRSMDYVRGLHALASAQSSLTNYGEAEELLRRALKIQGSLLAGDHPLTARLLHSLSIHYERREQPETALPLCRQALTMRRQLYGDQHPSIAASLNLLASLERSIGLAEEALRHFEESLGMQRRLLKPEHPWIAGTLNNIASLLHHDLGRPQEAEPAFREAVEIGIQSQGEGHPNVGFYLTGLGEVLTDLGRFEEAVAVLERALDLWHGRPGEQIRNKSITRSALAGAFLEVGRLQEAEELLTGAYPVLSESLGDGHRVTRRALDRLVRLFTLQGDPPRAAEYQAILDAAAE